METSLTINDPKMEDIQELRRIQPTVVPERYVRDQDEQPARSKTCTTVHVPVVDMAKLDKNDGELARLSSACEEWGFFQLVNHGIDEKLMDQMEELAREFFMLPLEEKEKYPMVPGTIQGYGHAFVFSEDQKLDWCNMLALGLEPAFIRNPKLWPTKPQLLSETLNTYSSEIRKLCQRILKNIAETLGISSDTFNTKFGEAVQAVRMNYYPPCARPDLVLGLSSHSDGSGITVLQQDMNSVGLQVLKDDKWVPINPLRNAFVINIGDTLEVMTNGKYKSVEHRAVTNNEIDRLSIVTFYAPSYDVQLGPLPELVTQNQPAMYKTYNHGEYNRHYVTHKLEGKKTLDFAKI
ncbi:hypothetical protein LUZ60_006820 [Juncus effusus]|nr:hypothetical protein LUZ60_006820 [Juncus effusus]